MPEQETRSSKIIRVGSRATLIEPEGTYTVLYGAHVNTLDPEALPYSFDILAPETGIARWDVDPLSVIHQYQHNIQYGLILQRLEHDHTPVLFLDTNPKVTGNENLDGSMMVLFETAIMAYEAKFGIPLLSRSISNLINHRVPRRSFLKTAGGVTAGIWLSSPLFAYLSRIPAGVVGIDTDANVETSKAIKRIHPESLLLMVKLRNVISAYKMHRLMETWGDKPHIVSLWGAAHDSIEDFIQAPLETKYLFLRDISPLLQRLYPATFYQAVKFNYENKDWNIATSYEFPELKQLVTG